MPPVSHSSAVPVVGGGGQRQASGQGGRPAGYCTAHTGLRQLLCRRAGPSLRSLGADNDSADRTNRSHSSRPGLAPSPCGAPPSPAAPRATASPARAAAAWSPRAPAAMPPCPRAGAPACRSLRMRKQHEAPESKTPHRSCSEGRRRQPCRVTSKKCSDCSRVRVYDGEVAGPGAPLHNSVAHALSQSLLRNLRHQSCFLTRHVEPEPQVCPDGHC